MTSEPLSDVPPNVAVLTVTYNSAHVLPGLIASLAGGLRGLEWEFVVADNASTDDTVEVARRSAPFATVVQTGRNAGYAAGINAAKAAAAPFDAALVVNPDVRLLPGCGAALLDALEANRADLAVPHLVDAHGELILSMRREPTVARAWAEAILGARRAGLHPWLGEVVSAPETYQRIQRVDWAEGSTIMISADAWRRCGPWDESYFLYSEETEYALRARDLGLEMVYVPQARAIHLEGGSSSPPQWALLVLNKVRLFRRRHGWLRTVWFWAAQVWREGTRALLGRRTSRLAVHGLFSVRRLTDERGPHWLQV